MTLSRKFKLFTGRMLILVCLPILGIASSNPTFLEQELQLTDSLESKIDQIMSAYSKPEIPGAVIGIIHHNKLVFSKGYGMANFQAPKSNHPDNIYKIASVSKQFTAASVLSLIRQQKLKLTDDVRNYLPELPQYNRPITIADLLYHTSGIRDYMVLMWLSGKSFEDNFSNEDALQMIYRQQKLHFNTGTRCVYSNSNYVLLAAVVQKITGKTISEYADQQIFKPLKMANTGFGMPNRPLVTSYQLEGSSTRPYKNQNAVVGDGGMYTTLADLMAWDKTFYDKTSLANGILERGKLDNGAPLFYGMGIIHGQYRDLQIQMHPGAFLGYRAEMLRFPEQKITIICLGNNENINPEEITRQIADAYIFKDRAKVPTITIEKNIDTQPLVGKYEVAPNVFIEIKFENNKLSGQVTGQVKQFLHLKEANTYYIGDSEDLAIFDDVLNGKMQTLYVAQKNVRTVAKRPEIISGKDLENYVGTYHSIEQKVSYKFYIKNDKLWFKMGDGAEVQTDILKNYSRLHFGYQNLEQATIDFQYNAIGKVSGFTLNSGRVSGLSFEKVL